MDKKSFVMYMSWMPMLKAMPTEQLGELMKAVACYQTGEDVEIDDPVIAAIWEMMKATFEEDAVKYEEMVQRNSERGKLGGRPKKPRAFSEKPKKAAGFSEKPEKTKKADNESESDNESDLEDIKPYSPAEPDDVDPVDQIVEHLNDQIGSSYKTTTPKTRQLIRSRMKEGFSAPDFFVVIDKMVKEWKGTDQEKYLRPETLFGTKFEGYLNRKTRASPQNHYEEVHEYDNLDALEAALIRQTAEGRAG